MRILLKQRNVKRTKLTYEWQPYDGDYEKSFQDIKLKDGTEVLYCYPNAGFYNELYGAHRRISEEEVTHVRLTSKKFQEELFNKYSEAIEKAKREKEASFNKMAEDLGTIGPNKDCSKGHRYISTKMHKDHKEIWKCKNCEREL